MAVTVTGQFADDSYVPDGSDRVIRRHRLEAQDIAISLRWATATVTRTSGRTTACSTETSDTDASEEAPEPAESAA